MALTKHASVRWLDNLAFSAQAEGSEHAVLMDSPITAEAETKGPSPMDLVLMALGGCTGMDVISILKKQRQEVTGCEVNVTGDRNEEHPKYYRHIVVEHVIRGRNLSREAVERAVDLSANKYCSVGATLDGKAEIEQRIRLVEE